MEEAVTLMDEAIAYATSAAPDRATAARMVKHAKAEIAKARQRCGRQT